MNTKHQKVDLLKRLAAGQMTKDEFIQFEPNKPLINIYFADKIKGRDEYIVTLSGAIIGTFTELEHNEFKDKKLRETKLPSVIIFWSE